VAAERRAADRVTLHQLGRIALPRRFSLPMQEIWLMQGRFSQRQRKRVVRTLSHPRFRAAYDFLVLRRAASPAHEDDIAFWQQAQRDPDAAIAAQPEDAQALEEGAAPRKRRRRRRRSHAAGE